jgi:hypothetical protein
MDILKGKYSDFEFGALSKTIHILISKIFK